LLILGLFNDTFINCKGCQRKKKDEKELVMKCVASVLTNYPSIYKGGFNGISHGIP
jgi:hypothetical protein